MGEAMTKVTCMNLGFLVLADLAFGVVIGVIAGAFV